MKLITILLSCCLGISPLTTLQDNILLWRNSSALIQETPVNITAEPNAIQVNIYGGSFPAGTGWNNWNVQANLTFNNLLHADGSSSTVSANLTLSNAIADNGASYPVTMCPVEVGRTASYSTVARYVTLSGLNNTKHYDLEVYASRANTGNSTKFSVGSRSISILTDRNYSNKAVFTDLVPSSGQIRLYIERLNTYNYINGFVLKESSGSPANTPPVANAGPNQIITLPVNQVTLNGAGSYDPDGTISTYRWQRLSGPGTVTISNPQNASTLVSNLTKGVHIFSLTVTDNNGDSATASTQVTVNDPLPPAGGSDSLNCGKAFKIVVLGSSTAMGSGATPIDSAWVNKYRRYARSKNTQTTVTNLALSGFTTYHILCPNGFVPPANRPAPDTAHNITKALSYAPDLIIISLPSNDAQKNFPLSEQQANYERTMALTDALHIPVWVTTTQPRNAMNSSQMNLLTSMRDWTYQRFGEKAIDFWTGLANPDGTVNELYNVDGVHVNNDGHHLLYTRVLAERLLDTLCLRKNLMPVARAGSDISISLPVASVQLSGTQSSDPDGSIVSYSWSKISGPSGYSINNAASPSPIISSLVQGTYQIQLTVTDNLGAKDSDTVAVTVKPATLQPPVARAGNDITLTLPANSTTLNGSNSFDPDGSIVAYNWSKIAGPASYVISNPAIASPVISGLTAGIYQFRLTVRDNDNLNDDDSVSVIVNSAPNIPPVANAGPDQSITQPASSVTLNANGSTDADGTISAYQWMQLSGPSTATITNAGSVTAVASNLLLAGNYTFQLTVRDNNNAEDKDTMRVIVNTSPTLPRTLQVNIFGGNFPAGAGWNNWNVQSSLTLGSTFYSDGTPSPISATLSLSNAIADNGAGYPVTMCPPEVGRTTSYSTVMRLVTLSGLDNSKKYDLEVYASRNGTGNSTKFSVNTTVINILTDKNYSNKAIFRQISPANGRIQLKIERLNTYNYINGFTLNESQQTTSNISTATAKGTDTIHSTETSIQSAFCTVSPNPFQNRLRLMVNNPGNGYISITMFDQQGLPVYTWGGLKAKGQFPLDILAGQLSAGVYFIKIQSGDKFEIIRVIKSGH